MSDSNGTPRIKRRKRHPQAARDEALDAARTLLLERGPGAVTLAGVGRAIGMSHTNLIHHFGSAGALHGALMTKMVRDLIDAIDGLVTEVRAGTVAPLAIVDRVFDAFAGGGAGPLAAWLILSGERDHLDPVRDAVNDLVEAVGGKFANPAEADARVRSAILLVAIGAFGDAMIGPDLRGMLAQKPNAVRHILAKILPLLFMAA